MRQARLVGVVAVLCVLAAACGRDGEAPLQIGVKRSALDLIFKQEGDEERGSAEEALVPQPAPAHAAFVSGADAEDVFRPGPVAPVAPPCPEAGPDTFPEEPVTTTISKGPKPGTYAYHNTGTFKIEGSFNLEGAYPPLTTKTVSVLAAEADSERFRIRVVQGLGENVTTTVYRVVNNSLDLVSLHTKTADGESTFEPTPPVRLMQLGVGEGASWNSAGVDPDRGTAMVVEGEIEKREIVDVCGRVYDTYRVVSTESITNAFTGFTYETNEPTVYNVATHLGGIFLREDVDSTTRIPTGTGFVTVHLDFVSTASSVDPAPVS